MNREEQIQGPGRPRSTTRRRLTVNLSKAQTDTARMEALAEENARLIQDLHRQLQEVQRSRRLITAAEERTKRNIAEMLHGRVQTRLLVAWHRLGECEKLVGTDCATALALLQEVRDEIDQIREQDVRQASHLLHPSIIRVGLVPAVRSLVRSFESRFQLVVNLDPRLESLDSPLHNAIPTSCRLTAYRAIEEALNNALRHAKPSKVEISLGLDADGQLRVEIADDGVGFDKSKLVMGLGLESIAGRVDQEGGSWDIVSAPGQGTRLSVKLPIDDLK